MSASLAMATLATARIRNESTPSEACRRSGFGNRGLFFHGELLLQPLSLLKSTTVCHSERSEESLFGRTLKERFLASLKMTRNQVSGKGAVHRSAVVIAPRDAELTSFAYFANTPVLYLGSGAFHFARRALISLSLNSTVRLFFARSKTI